MHLCIWRHRYGLAKQSHRATYLAGNQATPVAIHAPMSRTGSGKTHTMLGGAGDGRGVIPRALEKLYARANELQRHHGWLITLQVLGPASHAAAHLCVPSDGRMGHWCLMSLCPFPGHALRLDYIRAGDMFGGFLRGCCGLAGQRVRSCA